MHNQMIVLSIPSGTHVDVLETPGSYVTSYRIGQIVEQSNVKTNLALDDDVTVAFTNDFPAVGPTGVSFRSLPIALMMAVGLALPMLMPRRRRREED